MIPNIDLEYPKGEVIPIGYVYLIDIYKYVTEQMTRKSLSSRDLRYLGYETIDDFFLNNLDEIYNKIIIENDSDTYINCSEEFLNLGLSDDTCDNVIGMLSYLVNEITSQVKVSDVHKLRINVIEGFLYSPRALVYYINV